MSTPRTPPGRAGRLRLKHRLAVAERGADLLEQKLRALTAELARRRAAQAEADREWLRSAEAARERDDRAAVLDGRRAFDAVVPTGAARVRIEWRTSMGVRFPDSATCEVAEQSPKSAPPESTALVLALAAFRDVVPAAARAAAEAEAVRTLEDAVLAARRQVRALRRHWIPELAEALARLEAGLEQSDHEDAVRRMAGARPGRSALVGPVGSRDADSEQGVSR